MTSSDTFEISTDEGTFEVFFAAAPASSAQPALIICSEAFGVNTHMRDVAQRFALQGYQVFVPELFWRIGRKIELPYNDAGLKRAGEIAEIFDKIKGTEDIGKLVDVARKRADCTGKIGILGFCVGGAAAYLAAARLDLDACVSYYGKGIEDYLGEVSKFHCPAALHYGGADRFIPPAVIARVRNAFAANANVGIYEYPGVDHGFNSEDRRAYNPDAAKLAMERTLAVLERGLRASQPR
jgi:carboxymethylenebutenolidase